MEQLVLDDVLFAYQAGTLDNDSLYQSIATRKGISQTALNQTVEIGSSGKYTSALPQTK